MSKVVLPERLTAENGAKALLSGEFFETIDYPGYCECGDEDCDLCELTEEYMLPPEMNVPISWSTIKEIYKLAVENMAEPAVSPTTDKE